MWLLKPTFVCFVVVVFIIIVVFIINIVISVSSNPPWNCTFAVQVLFKEQQRAGYTNQEPHSRYITVHFALGKIDSVHHGSRYGKPPFNCHTCYYGNREFGEIPDKEIIVNKSTVEFAREAFWDHVELTSHEIIRRD